MTPDVTVYCRYCCRFDAVPAEERALGCRHCGRWPDGHRGTVQHTRSTRFNRAYDRDPAGRFAGKVA
jgi:hypothetical protein